MLCSMAYNLYFEYKKNFYARVKNWVQILYMCRASKADNRSENGQR